MRQKSNFLSFICIIFIFLQLNFLNAQTTARHKCDSLIQAGIAALDKNQHTRSIEFLYKAHSLAKKNSWPDAEFLALKNIGTNYYRLSEYTEALNYFLEAYNIALKKLTVVEEIKVLNNIALIYFEEKKYSQAKDYFTKVYLSAKGNKEDVSAGIAAINLGTLSIANKDFSLAENYYTEALQLVEEKPEYIVLAKGGLANCYLQQGKPIIARNLANHLLTTSQNPEFYHLEIELLTIISKSYLQEKDFKNALGTIEKVFAKKPNAETKIKLFELISEINEKRNRLDLALQYKDSMYNAALEFNESKNKTLFENSKVKFDLQNYKNESLLNESKMASERKILYYIMIFISVLILLAFWTFRNQSLKLRQKKLIAERNEQILALQLEKEKKETLLLENHYNENKAVTLQEQERLKNEVESKNRKLSAKALYLSGRNQMIEEILSGLSALPQVSKDSALNVHMKSLENQLKSDNEWNHFITHFEDVNQGFLNSLNSKHPTLTINDIRYISYIYMNLSTKEIASMLNITQESCRKRKERILAKLGLSKETNLYTYLTSI